MGLLLVLSIFNLLDPLGLLPIARLVIEMRYKLIAVVSTAACVLTAGLSVLLAWMGFHAYSFVWPTVIVGLLTNTVYWLLIRPGIRWDPQFRRWKFLLNDTGMMLGTVLCTAPRSRSAAT